MSLNSHSFLLLLENMYSTFVGFRHLVIHLQTSFSLGSRKCPCFNIFQTGAADSKPGNIKPALFKFLYQMYLFPIRVPKEFIRQYPLKHYYPLCIFSSMRVSCVKRSLLHALFHICPVYLLVIFRASVEDEVRFFICGQVI